MHHLPIADRAAHRAAARVGDPVEALAARAASAPESVAVITPEVRLTAGELWDAARRAFARLAALDPERLAIPPQDPDAMARIVHSSGTTGAPKAAE